MGSEQIRLVGGPYDGRRTTIPAGRGVWRMMPPTPIGSFNFDGPPPELPQPLNYRVLRDETGDPSRDDDGTLVYELDVPGVSSHYRCRLFVDRETYGWPALVLCRCGVAVSIANQAVLDDFKIRHFLDPTYGRMRMADPPRPVFAIQAGPGECRPRVTSELCWPLTVACDCGEWEGTARDKDELGRILDSHYSRSLAGPFPRRSMGSADE